MSGKMAFLVTLLSALALSSRASDIPLKTIAYRGGVVTFQVPRSWKEVYTETDGAEFYEETPNSPTFRLRLLTFRSPAQSAVLSPVEILNVLRQVQGKAVRLPSGNALFAFREVSEDRGQKLIIYYWMLANAVPPDHARIANFSFTVLAQQDGLQDVRTTISRLDEEIRRAQFSAVIGETSR